MKRYEFDQICAALPQTTNVIQWGDSSVWKIGGKIFALCSVWGEGQHEKISFKCDDHSYAVLCELEGVIPAPYLARAKWVQLTQPDVPDVLSDQDITDYIHKAYGLVVSKLTKAKRKELNLL